MSSTSIQKSVMSLRGGCFSRRSNLRLNGSASLTGQLRLMGDCFGLRPRNDIPKQAAPHDLHRFHTGLVPGPAGILLLCCTSLTHVKHPDVQFL
jgi:hypothetical protein